MKARLAYTVRSTRAPGETRDVIVPVIVERLNPVELETVVENCIDRGLIAGLKTTAAHGIAEGVAAQIAREFTLGRGVQFGQYFYGRPYLSGTVDANGRLTGGNRINVRLYKGEAFRLTLDDFSFTFDGAGDAVKIDSIYGDTTDAGGNTYGQLVAGAPVKVNGRNLYAAGDTDKVLFDEAGGGATVAVEDFATQSADLLSFAWPAGLVAGKAYKVRVERTDVNGVTRTSAEKKVVVVAGAVPPGPATVTISGIDAEGRETGTVVENAPIRVHGTGLNMGEGDALYMKRSDLGDDEYHQVPEWAISEAEDGTRLVLDDGDTEGGAGEYFWGWFEDYGGFDSEHHGITLKLVSHGGVPSSEPQTVTASANVVLG